ncbi:MAG: 50S ribosomal protein L29 [Candidatus Bipolaricaulota bacterium]|nr:50S ribosomal protein L29 [Candidatus Bipolaricaulota bacterium]
MKVERLRELTIEELDQKEREFKRKLFNLRFQLASAELDNTAELEKTRRDIARVMTITRAKEREAKR